MAVAFPIHEERSDSPERLGFIFCFAAALHAALILGISFSALSSDPKLPSLEVTLAQYQSQNAPEKADYIAQHDQLGSGSLKDKAELSSRIDSAFHDNSAPPEHVFKQAKAQQASENRAILHSRNDSAQRIVTDQNADKRQPQPLNGDDDMTELSENIAALEAQLDHLNQAYASMPRPKFITSVATRGSPDALYLDRWESHVEHIGNLHYPESARKRGLTGELRMLLMLFPDGRIDEVRIMRSSGHPELDKAANRIVRLAAPYEAIPKDVLDGKNRLGIVRTWRFERNSLRANSR